MAPSVNDVLNFALKLEYLEADFYNRGLGAMGATATAAQTLAALDKIRNDETAHVAFLRTALGTNANTLRQQDKRK